MNGFCAYKIHKYVHVYLGFTGGASGKELPVRAGDVRDVDLGRVEKIPWRRAWRPTPVYLPGESHGHRSLTGHSP